MWHFDNQIKFTEKLFFSAFFVAYAFVLYGGFMPEEGWAYVSSSTIILGIVARMPQILQNFNAKSTGHLAFATFFLMFGGTIARTATVFFESKDVMLRAQMGMALLLNTILIVQFALYWNSTPTQPETKKPQDKKSVYDKVNAKPETKKKK
jgi:hypothetical protein